MSKIPSVEQLPRDIPQVSGDIDVRGVGANIGQGLIDVARVTSDIYQRRNRNLMAKANADMAVDLIAGSSELDQDPDYATHDKRFTDNIEKRLGEHAATITDASLREQFTQNYRPKIAAARESVKNKAWGKEQDFERGELITRLETLRNGAITSGDITGANEAAVELIQSHTDLAHINEDDAVKIRNSFRDDLSKGFITAQEPEKRVEALKQPWAKKYLAPDEFAVMKREADKELRIGKAQTQVDAYLEKGFDRADAMADIDKKYSKDPELRKEVEDRFDYAFNKQEKAIVEDQSELFDEYFLPVRAGESVVADIPREDLERMSPAQQSSLFSAQASSVSKTAVPFNIGAEDRLNALYQTKKFQQVREYYIENAGTMSDSQNKAWSKVSIEGIVPPEIKSLFTATASLDAKTPGYTKERRGPLKEALNDWYQSYQEETGQKPTDDVIDKQTNRMIMEYDTSWWWGGTKPIFEMSEEEKTSTMVEAREEDPASFDDATEYFKAIGVQPDHSQFMEAYTLLRDKRSAR